MGHQTGRFPSQAASPQALLALMDVSPEFYMHTACWYIIFSEAKKCSVREDSDCRLSLSPLTSLEKCFLWVSPQVTYYHYDWFPLCNSQLPCLQAGRPHFCSAAFVSFLPASNRSLSSTI